MSEPLTVLVTRPEPGGSATAAVLRALGHVPILAPCLSIEKLPATLPATCDAIVIASAQALPGLPPALHPVPMFAVGDVTAERARRAGFQRVHSASGTATELAALVSHTLPARARVLLPCGEGHSLGLARDLRTAGLRVTRRLVYRSRPATSLGGAAAAALEADEVDRVLVFSPATAKNFAALITQAGVRQALRRAIAIAISAAAASPLSGLGFAAIRTAVSPDQDHMLSLLS